LLHHEASLAGKVHYLFFLKIIKGADNRKESVKHGDFRLKAFRFTMEEEVKEQSSGHIISVVSESYFGVSQPVSSEKEGFPTIPRAPEAI